MSLDGGRGPEHEGDGKGVEGGDDVENTDAMWGKGKGCRRSRAEGYVGAEGKCWWGGGDGDEDGR